MDRDTTMKSRQLPRYHSTNELENLEIVINQDEPGKKYLSYSFDANGKQLYERSFTAEKTNNDSVIQIDLENSDYSGDTAGIA